MSEEQKGPARESAQRLRMMPMWRRMDAILGGVDTMRAAGQEYMPMHLGEDSTRYRDRLKVATLWNQTELTLNGWVGRPFSDPLKLNEDVPDQIKDLDSDIDTLGSNMHAFGQSWFRTGLAKGFCHVLIDTPRFQRPEGMPDEYRPTIKDIQDQNIRPYWCIIEPEQILDARVVIEKGKEYWSHIRILETTMEPDREDEFASVPVERIRVVDRISFEGGAYLRVRMYRKLAENESPKEKVRWVQEDEFEVDFPVIPLVTFYADRQGLLLGKPPLQDLCDMNIKHWQSQSDQDQILSVARFPILAASGIESLTEEENSNNHKNKQATIGPFKVLIIPESSGRYYYVEHSGRAIKSGQDSLDKLEAQMAGYGSEFLKKMPDRQTATARALDSAESVSPLQAMTKAFMAAFNQALAMTARWFGIEPTDSDPEFFGGTIELVTDFGPEDVSGIDLSTLTAARAGRDLSRSNYLLELHRRGVLREDFNDEENESELTEEVNDVFNTVSSIKDSVPGEDSTGGDKALPKGDTPKETTESDENNDDE